MQRWSLVVHGGRLRAAYMAALAARNDNSPSALWMQPLFSLRLRELLHSPGVATNTASHQLRVEECLSELLSDDEEHDRFDPNGHRSLAAGTALVDAHARALVWHARELAFFYTLPRDLPACTSDGNAQVSISDAFRTRAPPHQTRVLAALKGTHNHRPLRRYEEGNPALSGWYADTKRFFVPLDALHAYVEQYEAALRLVAAVAEE